jgi:hypothetical protein
MRRRQVRHGLEALFVAGVAALALAAASPAFAGPATGAGSHRLIARGAGVYGVADVAFQDEYRIDPIDLYVWDDACDSSSVYAHFIVYGAGGPWRTQERQNHNGCHGDREEWHDLYIHDGNGIYGVQLEACVDSAGSDECVVSEMANNPYLPWPEINLRTLISGSSVGVADGVTRFGG